MITSPSRAIGLLGGPKVVSARIEKPLTTVASWMARESIPVGFWPQLVAMATEKTLEGFTYETLVRAHEKQVRRRGAA